MSANAFRYSRSDYEAAVAAFTDGGQTAPACFRWRSPREFEHISGSWRELSLEDKISRLAMLIGYYVEGTAENARHVITYGYEMLCRRNELSDR